MLEFSLTCLMRCRVFLLSSSSVLQKHLGFPAVPAAVHTQTNGNRLSPRKFIWSDLLNPPHDSYTARPYTFRKWFPLPIISGNKASLYKIKHPQAIKLENRLRSFLIANRKRFRSITTGENFPGDNVSLLGGIFQTLFRVSYNFTSFGLFFMLQFSPKLDTAQHSAMRQR